LRGGGAFAARGRGREWSSEGSVQLSSLSLSWRLTSGGFKEEGGGRDGSGGFGAEEGGGRDGSGGFRAEEGGGRAGSGDFREEGGDREDSGSEEEDGGTEGSGGLVLFAGAAAGRSLGGESTAG
jgi:hypothetical protein